MTAEDAVGGGGTPPTRIFRVTVYGSAKPAGSKRAFALKKDGQYTGRVAVSDDAKGSKGWKRQVAQIVGEAIRGQPIFEGALSVRFRFYVIRPKGHFGSGRNAAKIRGAAPIYPTVRPDLLKLARAVEDAMSKVAYRDDSQIVTEHLEKHYGTPERVEIELAECEADAGEHERYSAELEF